MCNVNENEYVYGYQKEWSELRVSPSVVQSEVKEVTANA